MSKRKRGRERRNPDPAQELLSVGLLAGAGFAVYEIGKGRGWWGSGSTPPTGTPPTGTPGSSLPGNYVPGEPTNFYDPTQGPAYVVPGGAFLL